MQQQVFLTGTLPADLNIENLFSRPFRAQRVELPRETVLPGYSPQVIEASANGLTLGVVVLKMDAPTTRRGLTL